MGMFTGVEDAKASFDAVYVNVGHYILRIDRVKADESRKKEQFMAVEMTTLHQYGDCASFLKEGDSPDKLHRPGQAVSHLMMAKHESFKGNVKAMIANILGVHETEVSEKDCNDICGEGQPLGGMIIEVRAQNILTRDKRDFTKVTYVREVPASELFNVLDQKIIDTYFPEDVMAKMLADEAEDN